MPKSTTCFAEECDKPAVARSRCSAHYQQWVRDGGLDHVREVPVCTETDCRKSVYARGLCNKHYQREKKRTTSKICTIDGCESGQTARSWCSLHYGRFRRYGDPLAELLRPAHGLTLEEHFHFYMPGDPPEASSPTEGCWDWTGARFVNTDRDGLRYGSLTVSGVIWRAHRASFTLFNGEIPDGLVVRHTCDRPICVQPAHLILGTSRDNTQDSVKRGRRAVGENAGPAGLTEDAVRAIREQYAVGGTTYAKLADLYGVGRESVRNVVLRKTWRHVE